jgi:hypothetical protein
MRFAGFVAYAPDLGIPEEKQVTALRIAYQQGLLYISILFATVIHGPQMVDHG